jgi:hypothetical protein
MRTTPRSPSLPPTHPDDTEPGGRAGAQARRSGLVRACAVAALVVAAPAGAQMPGLPLLQSPFTEPQIAVALNAGQSDDADAITAAASWTPASGRVQVSGGVGRISHGDGSGLGGAVRAYLPLKLLAGQAVALGVFAGAGGDRVRDTTAVTAVPLGVTIGYRRAIGATRALSVYAVPFYSYTRVRAAGSSSNVFRIAAGADVIVVPRVGLTLGYEGGAKPGGDQPGPRSGVYGGGVSFRF